MKRRSNDLDELVTYSVENEPFIIPKKYSKKFFLFSKINKRVIWVRRRKKKEIKKMLKELLVKVHMV